MKIITVIESLVGISGGIYALLYYFGKLGYSGDKEVNRQKRVEEYGWLLILSSVACLFGGIGLLFYCAF